MLSEPMDILTRFPVRRSIAQKRAFRDEVRMYASSLGYPVTVEEEKRGVHNVIIGDPKTADYLITAHYDTPAVSLFPNFLTPTNFAVYLLYQIVVIVLFMLIALIVCLPVAMIAKDKTAAFLVWYVAYMVLAFLPRYGPANMNNYNDNTSGVVTLLETAKSMPPQHRHRVCFVLFDLEEKGLVGSAAYRKAHKEETDHQIIINLDCVGDGDEIRIFPTKKLKAEPDKMNWLKHVCGQFGRKNIKIVEKGFTVYPSDQKNFPRAVAIAAFRRSKWVGLYHGRIHTKKDTVLEHSNINILRAALTTLITRET